MITNTIRGDVFSAPQNHIAFAVNTQGYNGAGFAGAVSSNYWPALADIGSRPLGEVLQKVAGGKTFHALVCHSLDEGGWSQTPDTVMRCLDSLDIPDDETIAVVLMGAGMIGQMAGADVFAIMGGMARSKKKVVVYTL